MKKSILTLGLLFTMFLSFAQVPQTWESLKKDLEKSNKEIQNEKKNLKSKTWKSRAQLLYDISIFTTSGLYAGLPTEQPSKTSYMYLTLLWGEPLSKNTEGEFEVWKYPHKKVYVKDGIVQKWEETEYITEDAIAKSADALLKAVELDDKGKGKLKSKTTTKKLTQSIKNTIIDIAIGFYGDKKYDKAYEYMSKGADLCKLPKFETDTFYSADKVEYFLGIIAFNGKKYDNSEKHFLECVKSGYDPGISYHYLAETYKEQGSDQKFLNTIKKGFEKNPNEEQLVIDLINYYINKNQFDKVIEYLDFAIEKNPENASFYSVKGQIYSKKEEMLYENYWKEMENVLEYKKEAFRNRFDESKKAAALNKQKAAQKKADELYAEVDKLFQKADKLFAKALEIDSKLMNAAFNRGRLYYKRGESKSAESDLVFKIYKDGAKADAIKSTKKADFQKAVEYFEIAYNLDPKDRDTVVMLKGIYYQLRNKAKAQEYSQILEELEK